MKKRVAIIICILLALSLLAGCNKGGGGGETGGGGGGGGESSSPGTTTETPSGGGITLTYLCAFENFPDNFQVFIADYEAATGNKVDVQLFSAPEFDQMIRARVMSGQNFDLFRNDNGRQVEYMWPTDWSVPLNDRPWIDRMTETAKDMQRWSDGTIRSVPILNNSALGLLYNKVIFEEAGITVMPQSWPEFLDMCETLKQHGVVPMNIQLASGSEFGTTHLMHQLFANIFVSRGTEGALQLCDDLDHNRVKYYEVPEFVTALEQMVELKEKGYINEDFITTTFEMSQENLASHKVAMHPGADFYLQPLQDIFGMDTEKEIGFFMAPFQDTPGVMSAAAGVGLMAYSKSENLEEALNFIDMFASQEVQQKYMQSQPGLAAFKDVEVDSTNISRAIDATGEKGLIKSGLYDVIQTWPEMEARSIMQELMLGTITPVQMLEKIQAQAEIIAKSKGFEGW